MFRFLNCFLLIICASATFSNADIGIRTDIISALKPMVVHQDYYGTNGSFSYDRTYVPSKLIPIYIPFSVGKLLRIEPMFTIGTGYNYFTTVVSFGLGVFYRKKYSDYSSLQIGERYFFNSGNSDYFTSLATCFGGEYVFAKHVGVSLECQVHYSTNYNRHRVITEIPIFLTYYFKY